MHVAALSLADFRSYENVALTLEPGVSVFLGGNGHGKTNLLEAVGYLATLGSFRVATDAPLVRLGVRSAVVRATVVRDGRPVLIELEIIPGRANRVRVNSAPVPRPRELLGSLRAVLFAPEDLALVKGDPGERRRFLDELLVARTPRLATVRADYERVLRQRNALLSSAGTVRRTGDLGTLEVWDSHLARTGAELLAARLELVDALRPLVDKGYDAVSRGGASAPGPAGLDYRSSLGPDAELVADRPTLAAALLRELAARRRAELERGVSLVGPHRDDVVLKLGPLPARGYASQGEAWSFALALRLAAYDLLRGDGAEPVLLLDDVFAELDAGRRDRLAGLVAHAEQVLVTAAVAEAVPARLAGVRFEVGGGTVRRGSR